MRRLCVSCCQSIQEPYSWPQRDPGKNKRSSRRPSSSGTPRPTTRCTRLQWISGVIPRTCEASCSPMASRWSTNHGGNDGPVCAHRSGPRDCGAVRRRDGGSGYRDSVWLERSAGRLHRPQNGGQPPGIALAPYRSSPKRDAATVAAHAAGRAMREIAPSLVVLLTIMASRRFRHWRRDHISGNVSLMCTGLRDTS